MLDLGKTTLKSGRTIGILTWSRAFNYGCALQALALRTAIERLGLRAEFVHYEQGLADFSYWSFLGFSRQYSRVPFLFGWAVELAVRVFIDGNFVASLLRLVRTRAFFARYVPLSSGYYPDYPALCRQTEYGTIVVGSDQVWNPRFFNGVPGYLMATMPKCVRKVSYAASLAIPRIGDDIRYFKDALPGYAAVSVRESACIGELEKECGVRVEWVVDPTLLLSSAEWIAALGLPEAKDGGYIACYWLSDVEDALPRLFSFAKASGRKVRLFSGDGAFRLKSYSLRAVLRHLKLRIRLLLSRRVRFEESAGPRQFVAALAASSAVMSDSFHALMFATVFRKPVRIVIPPVRAHMSSRIVDFLSRVGMKSVLTDSMSPDMFSADAVYTAEATDRLNRWIASSKAFLEKALSEETR